MPSNLYEDTIAQFFQDVGFIPPPGFENIEQLFPMTGQIVDFLNDNGESSYEGVTIPLADKDSQNLFSGSYMLKDQGFISSPDYCDPPKNNLNKEYKKKNLDTTHSFSDSHLEELETPVAEFPRHAQVKSIVEPSQFDSIIIKDTIV